MTRLQRLHHPAAAVVLLAAVAGLGGMGGCARGNPSEGSFTKRIDKIRPGMTPAEVREAMGDPDQRTTGVVQMHPSVGPPGALVGILPEGTRYEDWFYKQGDTHYHVLFGPGMSRAPWEVVAVRAAPAGAAVGGRDVVPTP